MSDKRILQPDDLSGAISDALELYSEDVLKLVDKAGKNAVDELVRITKDTAPYDAKHHGRHYVSCIAADTQKRKTGNVYTWYVKAPCCRLTHLLVHGHATRNGTRRVPGDPFLHNAWDRVRPDYERAVEEAIQK